MLSMALFALSLPLLPGLPQRIPDDEAAARLLAGLRTSASRVEFVDAAEAATKKVHLVRQWQGPYCTFELNNRGETPVRVREVVLFELAHGLAPQSAFHGEGFRMASQTAGTLAEPQDVTRFTDRASSGRAEPAGMRSVYGCAWFGPPDSRQVLVGFTSSQRFVGRFDVSATTLRAVVELEGLALEPGSTWKLEELWVEAGSEREALYARLATAIAKQHPRRAVDEAPRGWRSSRACGAELTSAKLREQLELLAREVPGLHTFQVDAGYAAHVGDWLTTRAGFGGELREVLGEIKARGRVPGLWLAPLLAEESSELFRAHPDWFVRGADDKPLRADAPGSGAGQAGDWYALDGTHPAVQAHLEQLFRTLREGWGVAHFELDALGWGAVRAGRFHDRTATSVEAWRRALQAIRRGAGDAFLLGSNHPLWPSLGLIDGSRSAPSASAAADDFASIVIGTRLSLARRWQDGVLWWNDAGDLLIGGPRPEGETQFHIASVVAAGGSLFSGDDLRRLDEAQKALLARVTQIPPQARRSVDPDGRHVAIDIAPHTLHVFFNPTDEPLPAVLELSPARVVLIRDGWTRAELATQRGRYTLPPLAPRSARVLEVRPAPAASRERPKSASPSGSR